MQAGLATRRLTLRDIFVHQRRALCTRAERQSWQLGFSASPERNDGSYQDDTPARHRHQIRPTPRRRDLDPRDISEKIACGNCRKHEEERARHTERKTGFTRWRVASRLVLFTHVDLSARWPPFLCDGERSRAYTQPKREKNELARRGRRWCTNPV